MKRHTMIEIVNHSRSTALERSVKSLRGGVGGVEGGAMGGLNRFYVATTLALVGHSVLFSPFIYSTVVCQAIYAP